MSLIGDSQDLFIKKYMSDGTWFKKGTECILIDDYRPVINSGLFSGIRVCEKPYAEGNHKLDEEYQDEEICGFDEFQVLDE